MDDRAARFAVSGPAAALAIMVVQHGLRSDLSPWSDSISMYGVGAHAYVSTAAVVTLGLAALALARCLRAGPGSHEVSPAAPLLAVWGAGLLLLGVFDADDGPLDTSGVVHTRIAQFAFGIAVVAVVVLSRAFRRLGWWTATTALAWAAVSVAAAVATVVTLESPWFGVTERVLAVVLVAWSVAVGRIARDGAAPVDANGPAGSPVPARPEAWDTRSTGYC